MYSNAEHNKIKCASTSLCQNHQGYVFERGKHNVQGAETTSKKRQNRKGRKKERKKEAKKERTKNKMKEREEERKKDRKKEGIKERMK